MPAYVYAYHRVLFWSPEEGIAFPRAGVIGSCWLPGVDAGN